MTTVAQPSLSERGQRQKTRHRPPEDPRSPWSNSGVILRLHQERKRKKPTYRVTNYHEYNQSLKKREQISLYFPDGDLLSQFIDASPYTRGVSDAHHPIARPTLN
jgi:hypothetical protein